MPRVVLRAIGLSHRFGERRALAGVDLVVRPGVLTGLLGPNGAGKTTLMRALLGVIEPDDGQILWQERPVTFADRQRWGYMPQDRGLYPTMPAGAQLTYMARLHGLGRVDAAARARELLDELGLADRWGERTEKLSGGMQQRLQLGAALVHSPDVVVLDEPFAGLDPVAVEDLSVSLRDRVRAGRTVVLSSHQLDLVQDLCEEIVMIDHGRTVLAGAVAQLRASSGRRQLRLGLGPGAPRDWLDRFPAVHLVADQVDAVRLDIPAEVDPLAVLDAARAAGPVTDFGLDLPTLSQLFLTAAERAAQPEVAP
jgi:ABC-2 type transport system ATP-binding protein